jgi:hypothetical protein
MISNDATTMYKQAAALGAAPDGSAELQQLEGEAQALQQQQAAADQQAAERRAEAAASPLWGTRASFDPSEYTEVNHGLQALPHQDNGA